MEDLGNVVVQLWTMLIEHAYAGIGGLLCMVCVTLLTDRAKFAPTWNSPWRPFLGTVLGAVGLTLNLVQKGGTETTSAIVSIVATTIPTLLTELSLIRKGGGGSTAGGDATRAPEVKQPSGYSLSALPLAFATAIMLAVAPGCASLKNIEPDVMKAIVATQAGIQEANIWINIIQSAAELLFAGSPTSDAAVQFRKGGDAVKLALAGLSRLADGADAATKEAYDLAAADFKAAWKAFLGPAKTLGLVASDGTLSAKFGARPGVHVPELRLMASK